MALPAEQRDLEAAARRDLYALAARVFAFEVDAPLYERLISDEMTALVDASGLTFIEAELRAAGRDAALEALAVEYCQLFIAPKSPCSPYASIHRGERVLGGRARDALEAFCRRHGIELGEDARIASPDHAAVMLSALAHLTDDPDAGAAADELLRDHVLPWMPQLVEQVERHSERALYRTTAALTRELLAEERAARGL